MSIIEAPHLSNRKATKQANPKGLPPSGQVSTPTHSSLDTQDSRGGRGLDSLNDQSDGDTQNKKVVEGQISTINQLHIDTQTLNVDGGTDFNPDQWETDAQTKFVGVELTSTPTHMYVDTQCWDGGRGPILYDPTLEMAANIVDDMERVRIANENRLRQLTRDTEDDDGETRGLGLPIDHPDVARLAGIVEGLNNLEQDAIKNLQKVVRRHPLWITFLKDQKGVGEKQAGRLLAAISDPYWHIPYERPRTVSELWAYCGYHVLPSTQQGRDTHQESGAGSHSSTSSNTHGNADNHRQFGVAARRARGQKMNWNAEAKMRAYLIGAQCQRYLDSPYRIITDQRRAHTATTHPEWTPGHSLNDGIRITTKALLKDIWIAARDIHEGA